MSDKLHRAEKANALIKEIADCGRRFFYSEKYNRYARVEVDARGRVWFVDDYTGKRIYTHYNGRWRGFSHGGTLRDLVKAIRDFVSKSTPIPRYHFGPWSELVCGGDIWGYGEDMKRVREAALKNAVIAH